LSTFQKFIKKFEDYIQNISVYFTKVPETESIDDIKKIVTSTKEGTNKKTDNLLYLFLEYLESLIT
jgi:hypothetical protein